MRITQGMISLSIKENLARRASRYEQAQKRAADGVRVFRPSDDPGAVSRILAMRSLLGDVADRRYQAESGISVLNAADAVLNEIDNIIQKANELAIASGGGVNESDRKNSMAVHVEELIKQVQLTADTFYDDRPIFPDNESMLGATGVLDLGLSKDNVFGPAIAALQELHAELANGASASAQTMEHIKSGLDNLMIYRTRVGACTNRFEAVKDRMIEMEQDLLDRKSAEQEVDIALAIIDMKEEEVAYQSALSATSRIMQVSLVDFL